MQFFEKDGCVLIGVAVPNDILTDDEDKDTNCAKALLATREQSAWECVTIMKSPMGYQYKLFVFEAVPIGQKIVSR